MPNLCPYASEPFPESPFDYDSREVDQLLATPGKSTCAARMNRSVIDPCEWPARVCHEDGQPDWADDLSVETFDLELSGLKP